MEHKQLPFLGCRVALCGFEEAEAEHVQEIAVQNGLFVGCTCYLLPSLKLTDTHTHFTFSYFTLFVGVVVCNPENPKLTHLLCASGVAAQDIPQVPSWVHVVMEQVCHIFTYSVYSNFVISFIPPLPLSHCGCFLI